MVFAGDVLDDESMRVDNVNSIRQRLQQCAIALLTELQRAQVVLSPKNETDAMRERGPKDRFMDKIGSAGVVSPRDGRGVVVTGDHHHGNIGSRAQRAQLTT